MQLFVFYTNNVSQLVRLFETSALWSPERTNAKGEDYLVRTEMTAVEKEGNVNYSAAPSTPLWHKPRSSARPRVPRQP